MSTVNHATEAANHLAAVKATRDHLAAELASPNAKAHTVNVLRDDLRNGLKTAEVHALLNIGHHLAAMSGRKVFTTEVRLTSEAFAHVVAQAVTDDLTRYSEAGRA